MENVENENYIFGTTLEVLAWVQKESYEVYKHDLDYLDPQILVVAHVYYKDLTQMQTDNHCYFLKLIN